MDGSKGKSSVALVAALLFASTVPAQEQASTDPVSADTVARESAPAAKTSVAEPTNAKATPPVARNWWSDIDSDTDGKISAVEAKAYAGLETRFVAIDADRDGFVKLEEYRTFFENNVGKNP